MNLDPYGVVGLHGPVRIQPSLAEARRKAAADPSLTIVRYCTRRGGWWPT